MKLEQVLCIICLKLSMWDYLSRIVQKEHNSNNSSPNIPAVSQEPILCIHSLSQCVDLGSVSENIRTFKNKECYGVWITRPCSTSQGLPSDAKQLPWVTEFSNLTEQPLWILFLWNAFKLELVFFYEFYAKISQSAVKKVRSGSYQQHWCRYVWRKKMPKRHPTLI